MMTDQDSIVITGASSFVGAHLACYFADNGYNVTTTISSKINTYAGIRKERLDTVRENGAEIIQLDICNDLKLDEFISTRRPNYWIQHAGWAQAYGSLDYDLDEGHKVNVSPLTPLYKSLAAAKSCKGILITGSSAEYSDNDNSCRESDACWPSMPYGLSKLTETLRARELALVHEIPTRVARVFIPYGPLDASAKLIPSVADSLHSNKYIDLSPCTQLRDFIHVSDLADGYGKLLSDLSRNKLFDIFNLSSGIAIPLKDLLHAMADATVADRALLRFGARGMRPGEPVVSYGDNARARDILNWVPRPLNEAMKSYINAFSPPGK